MVQRKSFKNPANQASPKIKSLLIRTMANSWVIMFLKKIKVALVRITVKIIEASLFFNSTVLKSRLIYRLLDTDIGVRILRFNESRFGEKDKFFLLRDTILTLRKIPAYYLKFHEDQADTEIYTVGYFPKDLIVDFIFIIRKIIIDSGKFPELTVVLSADNNNIVFSINTNGKFTGYFYNDASSRLRRELISYLDRIKKLENFGISLEICEGQRSNMDFLLKLCVSSFDKEIERFIRSTQEELGGYFKGNIPVFAQSSEYSKFSLCFVDKQRFYKLRYRFLSSSKYNSMENECKILKTLSKICGFPQNPEFVRRDIYDLLSYDFIEGEELIKGIVDNFNLNEKKRFILRASDLYNILKFKGIFHGDIYPRNFLIKNNELSLIDFDQAYVTRERIINVDSSFRKNSRLCFCSFANFLTELGISDVFIKLEEDIKNIWTGAAKSKASSPGKNLAYYSWSLGDKLFPGERPWLQRWLAIEVAGIKFRDLKVLDLGSNIGLFSMYASLFGAKEVVSVDRFEDILNVSQSLSGLFGISNIRAQLSDLNVDKTIIELAKASDLGVACSVYQWLKDKSVFDEAMLNLKSVIYEGHQDNKTEEARLRQWGFNNITLVGYSERLRGIYFAEKR